MGTGKTYSTKYLLDSNNSSGVAGQVLSTTSTGIDWVNANTVPGAGLWIESGNNIYNSNSGNVGIGTTGPTYKLDVVGNGRFSGFLEMATGGAVYQGQKFYLDGGGDTFLESPSSNIMTFTTNAVEKMRINPAGNVGIGVVPVTSWDTFTALQIQGSSLSGLGENNTVLGSNVYHNSNAFKYIGTGAATLYQQRLGEHKWFGAASGTAGNTASVTQHMVIEASGDVGIGTTNPDDRLDVIDGNAQMVFGTASSDRTYMQFKHNAVPTDGDEICLMDFTGYNSASQDVRYAILTTKAEDVTDGSEDGSLLFLTMKAGVSTNTMTLRSGNVGVGTPDPLYPLNVSIPYAKTSTGTQQFAAIFTTNEAAASAPFGLRIGIIGAAAIANRYAALQTTDYNLADGGNIVMQAAGGNVGIGTTSPDYKFEVQGVISSADAGLQKATFANVGNDLVLTANADATNVTAKMLFNSSGAGGSSVSTKMTIDGVGAIRFNNYNGADRAGTPTYLLGTDLQGNVVKTLGGAPSAGGGTTSQSKYYTSLTGSSTDFFPLFTINDVMGPVNCKIFTYAHDSLEFSVAEGYGPSNAGSITIINSVQTANGNYATVEAVRIDQAGVVEVKLTWGVATPTVSIGVLITGYQVPNLVASLATGTSTATTVDSVDVNTTGILRSKNKLQVGGTYLNASANTISLNRTGNSYFNAGNVGIGTISPATNFVVSDGGGTGLEITPQDANTRISLVAYDRIDFAYRELNFDGYNYSFRTSGNVKAVMLNSGNVGIGTTSPTSKLELGPNGSLGANITNQNIILNLDGGYGTTGTPSGGQYKVLGFVGTTKETADITTQTSGETTKNFYAGIIGGDYFNSNRFSVWQAGVERLTILGTATGSGNVGIGTSNPAVNLHVVDTSNTELRVTNDSTTDHSARIQQTDSGTFLSGSDTSNVNQFVFRAYGASFINAGNVGIGTTGPTEKLEVRGGVVRISDSRGNDSGILAFGNFLNGAGYYDNAVWRGALNTPTSSGNFMHMSSYSGLVFTTQNAVIGSQAIRMYIPGTGGNAGYVGIGTTSPGDKLSIEGSGSVRMSIYSTDTGSQSVPKTFIDLYGENTAAQKRKQASIASAPGHNASNAGELQFFTNDSSQVSQQRMTIREDGSVGIGTTSPSQKLVVEGTNHIVTINNPSTAANEYSQMMLQAGSAQSYIWTQNQNSTTYGGASSLNIYTQASAPIAFFTNGNNERMRITAAGDALFSGTVGINISTTPAEKLELNGNMLIQGDLKLGTSSSIALKDQPAASAASGSGTIVNWSVSESVTQGDLYAVKTNGGWAAADADTETTATYMLALALATNAINGMLLQGFFYKSSHGFVIGAPLYISNTPGAFSNTRPTGSGDYVRIIGYATSTNYIYFDPDKTWIKLS